MGEDVSRQLSAVLLGLAGFVVVSVSESDDEIGIVVETTSAIDGCRVCGVLARPHGRRRVRVRDLPVAGRPTVLVWRKRLWRCVEPRCPGGTWSETHAEIAARAVLTERARRWAMGRVGEHGETVISVARQLGVGWHTVMRAVRDYGVPIIERDGRLDGVGGLGVDEHVWQHAGPRRRTGYATGIVDLTPGRPPRVLDVVAGRSGKTYADWLRDRDSRWRDGIRFAALDPFRGYATALTATLPDAVRVLDAFHVVRLGHQALDEIRRRVQHETLSRRGHKGDPLYEIRRLLLRGAEHLSDHQRRRLATALTVGDPHDEVLLAWQCAQQLRAVYHAPTPGEGRRRVRRVLDSFPTSPIPEIARLGRTLKAWTAELLAYFDTDGASNGPTEAMNLLIEKIRRVGHGFRNFDNYRLRLLLYTGTVWDTPRTAQIRTRRPRFVA